MIKKAAIIAMIWTTFAVFASILLGFLAIPFLTGEIIDPEHVTLALAGKLLPG